MAEGTTSQSSSAANDARRAATEAVDKGKEAAHHAMDAAKEAGAAAADELKRRATQQKTSAAAALNNFANKLSESKGEFSDTPIGGLVGQAENTLRMASTYLENTNPERYFSDFTDFARRNPALTLGGAVALGFLLARAGKTAAHQFSDTANTDMTSAYTPMASGNGLTDDGYDNVAH
ncbi:MAG: hypothetical protein SGJ21_02875 [Alphaproteobacteria bacterium]|nr:hypothetical protein [Alphaproteobacteria bacterium]